MIKSIKKIGLIALLTTAFVAGSMLGIKAKQDYKPLEIAISVPSANAVEINEKGWPVPDLKGYTKAGEEYQDDDNDGFKETLYEEFHHKTKTIYIGKYRTTKRTWAWSQGGDDFPQRPYLIYDRNCDGIFEEKYINGEDWEVSPPPCAK